MRILIPSVMIALILAVTAATSGSRDLAVASLMINGLCAVGLIYL